MSTLYQLENTAIRIGPDTAVEPLRMDASFWQRLGAGELGDFHNEFLVTCHRSDGTWSQSEMHPAGDEVVALLSGRVTFVLEHPEGEQRLELTEPGAFVVVPRGVWHHAEDAAAATLLFITAGEGTEHRPRP